MNRPRIAVLGSANIDLVCRVPRLPRPGETIRATDVSRYRGGKGANQAVGAARLGADVRFFGMVGADPFGDTILAGFEKSRVDASAVDRPAACSTGTATIWVADTGENAIVISEGANGHVDAAYVDRHLGALSEADVLLLQLEIPVETVAHVVRRLPPGKPWIVLDPAPAAPLDGIDASRLACITPNEEELYTLSGATEVDAGIDALRRLGVEWVVCTLGESGARAARDGEPPFSCEAFPVAAVDTTAAGDAFAAALAVGLAGENPGDLRGIVRSACAAGALAASKPGAWPSLPTEEEVRALLER